jgi:sec-independent protein translocase protein TatA
MGSIGMPELLLIALVVVIVFGAGKLPQLGRGLGEGIRNFREAMREGERSGSEKRPPETTAEDKAPPPAHGEKQ